MKLLYINTYIPYPLNSGGNQAFFMMADHVRKHHDLSVLLYVHHSQEHQNVEKLKELWPDVHFYIYEPHAANSSTEYHGMSWFDRKYCTSLEAICHSFTRKIERRKRKYSQDFVRANSTLFKNTADLTPDFCAYVQQVVSQGFDAVQVEFYEYLPLIHVLPSTVKKVFVHHELRFIRNENEYQLYEHPDATDLILLQQEKAQELAALAACDAIITLTEIDKQILGRYLPSEKIHVSPAITQTITLKKKNFRPAMELMFIGSGSHFPNADAMIWFCKQVVPFIRKETSTFPPIHISGDWPKDLQKTISHLCPEVVFDGFIDNLPNFLNGKISIVPIRIGSGMRMKILDAMAAAAPIITTSKGCEGLPVKNGIHCLIADEADEFAHAIVRLMHDVVLQQTLAENAQKEDNTSLNDTELLARRLAIYDSLF